MAAKGKGLELGNILTEKQLIARNERITKAIESCKRLTPLEFNPEFHIPLLIKASSRGWSLAEYCWAATITDREHYQWCDKYPDYALASIYGKIAAEAWWQSLGRKGICGKVDINAQMWALQMRMRFGYTDQKKLAIPELRNITEPQQQFNVIINFIASGQATAQEAHSLTNLVLSGIKVDEYTVLKQEVEKLRMQVESRPLINDQSD